MIELINRYIKYLYILLISFEDYVWKYISSDKLYTRVGIRKLFRKVVEPITTNFSRISHCFTWFLSMPNYSRMAIIVPALLLGEQRTSVRKRRRKFRMKSLNKSFGFFRPYMSQRMSSGTGDLATFQVVIVFSSLFCKFFLFLKLLKNRLNYRISSFLSKNMNRKPMLPSWISLLNRLSLCMSFCFKFAALLYLQIKSSWVSLLFNLWNSLFSFSFLFCWSLSEFEKCEGS